MNRRNLIVGVGGEKFFRKELSWILILRYEKNKQCVQLQTLSTKILMKCIHFSKIIGANSSLRPIYEAKFKWKLDKVWFY